MKIRTFCAIPVLFVAYAQWAVSAITDIEVEPKTVKSFTRAVFKIVQSEFNYIDKYEWSYRRWVNGTPQEWQKGPSTESEFPFIVAQAGKLEVACKVHYLRDSLNNEADNSKSRVFEIQANMPPILTGPTNTPHKAGTRVIVKNDTKTLEGFVLKCDEPDWLNILELSEEKPVSLRLSDNTEVTQASSEFKQTATQIFWDKAADIMDDLYLIKADNLYQYPREDYRSAPELEKATQKMGELVAQGQKNPEIDSIAIECIDLLSKSLWYHTWDQGNTISTLRFVAGISYSLDPPGTSIKKKKDSLESQRKARVSLSRIYQAHFRGIKMPGIQ